jgi:ferrous iron transport protein B
VILAFSIALWILTELPRTQPDASMTELQQQQQQLDNSFAADLGRTVQPIFAPLGFDWRITLGVLSSYAARETFVSAMGQIYAADVAESDAPLRDVLHEQIPIRTGLSILAFYVFALQCISTMAIMKRETGSWKWPALAFGITFVMAYVASFVVYNVF